MGDEDLPPIEDPETPEPPLDGTDDPSNAQDPEAKEDTEK